MSSINGYFRFWSEYNQGDIIEGDLDVFDWGFVSDGHTPLDEYSDEIKDEIVLLLDEIIATKLDGIYEMYGKVTINWYTCGNPLDGESWASEIIISEEMLRKEVEGVSRC